MKPEQLKKIDVTIIQSVLDDKAEYGLIELEHIAQQDSALTSQSGKPESMQEENDKKPGQEKTVRKKPEKPKLDKDIVKHLFSKD